MVLVAYEDAMCKSHSQTSLLRNMSIEIVQAYTYSRSRAGELGTRVQALALFPDQFHFSISVVSVHKHKHNYGGVGRKGPCAMMLGSVRKTEGS